MKLKFVEDNGDIMTKMINNVNELEFNYIEFIDKLYIGEDIEELEFNGNISEELKSKLQSMVTRINTAVKESLNEVDCSQTEINEDTI